ncbi:MAG: hypothetical protein A2Z09_01680 [Nitrospirae bacterium RBG_16_43_8]|nr:MAG: hypothetical protein A2Z09_01680 [Nitrospirae bacterium RBG_16_43_8]
MSFVACHGPVSLRTIAAVPYNVRAIEEIIKASPMQNNKSERNIPRTTASVVSSPLAIDMITTIPPAKTPRTKATSKNIIPIIAANPASGQKSRLPSEKKVFILNLSALSFTALPIMPAEPPKK